MQLTLCCSTLIGAAAVVSSASDSDSELESSVGE